MRTRKNDRFIVTEYREGKTLRELLASPIKLPDLKTTVASITAEPA